MKRLFRFACTIFAAAVLSMGFTAAAANDIVDMSNTSHGYVTVNYTSSAKLKVGIQYNGGKTVYRDCPSGKDASFSLDQGDAVSAKAAELCKNAKTDEEKVVAIYNYMADRYSYDYKLANEITSGKITKYIPDTAATLKGTTGICYDFSSLFAAMCRSQGIPCALTKGYAGSSYHAWNKVNLNGKWYQIDLTYAVTRSVKNVKTLHDCVSPLTYTNTSDALAVAAA